MNSSRLRAPLVTPLLALLALIGAALACSRPADGDENAWRASGQGAPLAEATAAATALPFLPPTRLPGAPILTPTPDDPHEMPHARTDTEQYVVQFGDTLGLIAQRYGVTLEQLIAANSLPNPNLLDVGQTLAVPAPQPQGVGPSFKVIPDSELVYGPASAVFDIESFVHSQGGYLAKYHEDLDGVTYSGAQVVARVAREFSVNPRLLLAVLQYQSNWLTKSDLGQARKDYPMGIQEEWRKGLYRQLSWAANNLNRGYYLWRANAAATWLLADGSVAPIDPSINAGTAGVQHMA
ncbi:MAG: LysM peptidoglycan-binding domain-containing protein, partial [Chloroflexi bacterium]|nr:LysM peptidoglycan-binding domain-containing protein [Chloroflexota bacterium]